MNQGQLQLQTNKSNDRSNQYNGQRENVISSEARKKINPPQPQYNQVKAKEKTHQRGSLSLSKLDRDFKINDKGNKNVGLKFLKLEQPHSSQGTRTETAVNNQIYQLQGQQRNQAPRTNSLMKNFCFFLDDDYNEGIKQMYDESLVEWKKFQNSKINEPKKLQRNSQLAPKQNIYLSLGKEKKFSLKDIQKIKKEQDEEKQNDRNVPMNIRRKSCECLHCGKLNQKQIQLQDLPFIPKQQKKYYDIKFRISTILAAPIRQPLRGGQKQSPPSSPHNKTQSQTNIPSASIQRRSFAYNDKQEKAQNNQKSKIGQTKNRNDNGSSNISPNTSIDKQDESMRNKRSSSRNLKWGDQVSETSIEESSSYKKRHCTVLVRKNSKFEAPMSPLNSLTQKKSSQTKVEGVLEKSVKEKSKCMTALMNFLKKIIEKVQKEEQQKLNAEGENGAGNITEQKPMTGTLQNLEEHETTSINKNSQNFSQNVLHTQEDEMQDSQQNSKKMGGSQSSHFNSKDFSRKRSSVGELFKPRSMKVSSPTLTDTIKLNQKSKKEVVMSMETLSQFRDRYLKQYADQANKADDKSSKKKKSQTQRSLQQSAGQVKRDFQIGRYQTGRNEQHQKMDNLIDQLMIFSENHTPLLQSPYFTEMKTEEQLFDKQYNKKNFYQKVFTTNVITEEPHNVNPSQTTRSFYNSNNNGTLSLMNVPTINTMTNLNQSSSPPPFSKQQPSLTNKKNKLIFAQNTQSSQQGANFAGPNYFALASRRNMSQNDLFLKNQSMANKFSSYLQPITSPKYTTQSQHFLVPPSNNQFNGFSSQVAPSTAPYLRNGLNTIESNGRKSNKYINESLHSPKKPSSSSAARFGSFQSSYAIHKNDSAGVDNHTTIKSFKELDILLDGPSTSQQNSKQSSLNSTLYNQRNSNPQNKIALITQDRKGHQQQNSIHNEKMPYINSGNNHNQPSSEENTVLIQNDSTMKNSSMIKNSQTIQKTNTLLTNGGMTGQSKYNSNNHNNNNPADFSRKQSLKQQ